MSISRRLSELSDEELGELVRETATFRLAVACSRLADEVKEIRENDAPVYDRLVTETHHRQDSNVRAEDTTRTIIDAFLDVVEDHADLEDHAEEVAERSIGDAIVDEEVET